MDVGTIAREIADHLRGLDSVATAEMDEVLPGDVWVTTQGGVRYLVSVGRTEVKDVEGIDSK